jgi:phosphomannomutase
MIGALLARYTLKKQPGATIICDIRSSRSLVDEIERLGGVAKREKVGHTHIRTRMRKEDAVLGIELSGHFFFKETFFSEGGPLPAFIIMEIIKEEKRPLSELISEIRKHHHSGEINSTVTRPTKEIYTDLEKTFPEIKASYIDGLSLESKTWWCNVRPSANDPVVRLNLEANTKDEIEAMRDKVLAVIRI